MVHIFSPNYVSSKCVVASVFQVSVLWMVVTMLINPNWFFGGARNDSCACLGYIVYDSFYVLLYTRTAAIRCAQQ